MTDITHAEMVRVLRKSGEGIVASLTPKKTSALGVFLRELIILGQNTDTLKKQVIYEQPVMLPLPWDEEATRFVKNVPALTPQQMDALHMLIGMVSEAAELGEAIARWVTTGKLDMENVTEELGDNEFYVEGAHQVFGIERETSRDHNKVKLAKRYAGYQYSNEAATNRADKA